MNEDLRRYFFYIRSKGNFWLKMGYWRCEGRKYHNSASEIPFCCYKECGGRSCQSLHHYVYVYVLGLCVHWFYIELRIILMIRLNVIIF